MRYTLTNGVERRLSSKFTDNYKFLVPLVVLLVGAIIIGLHNSPSQHTKKPLTLGIYTINSKPSSKSGGNQSSGHSGSGSSVASKSTPGSATPMDSSGTIASSVAPAASLQGGMGGGGGSLQNTGSVLPPSGGMGGGGSLGGGGSSGGGTSGGGGITPPPPPPTTFPCVDLAGASFTCTYTTCVPPLGLTNGQKAYVTTTGLCVVIN